ncbi:GntR family transcriptional regulator [Mycobacterium sp. NPDC003449]
MPQYQTIRSEIEARIRSGELKPGTRLPAEVELQKEYGVSRATVQKAVNELASSGHVVRHRGRGTHVAQGAPQMNLLRSVDPRQDAAGVPGRLVVVSAAVITAGKAEVDVPGINDEAPVIQLVRKRVDDNDAPFVIEVSAVPFSLAPHLLDGDLDDLKIRGYFTDHAIAISRSRMYFDPVLLQKRYAELLDIEPGVAILRRRRYMWRPNGQIAESAAYYLRPGTVDFYIEYSETETDSPSSPI